MLYSVLQLEILILLQRKLILRPLISLGSSPNFEYAAYVVSGQNKWQNKG